METSVITYQEESVREIELSHLKLIKNRSSAHNLSDFPAKIFESHGFTQLNRPKN
jgi:hypothetical protein